MIRVQSQPAPEDFEERVGQPGRDFLATTPRPRGKQWKNKEFWRTVIPDMAKAYGSICAYSSLWIKPEQPTIDHYISRNDNPARAYDWTNFRLALWRINTRKNKHPNVLDPFVLEENWFVLDFATFEIQPHPKLLGADRQSVIDTRDKLDLNHPDYCDAREVWFNAFRKDIEELRKRSPFIAHEMERQAV